MPNSRAGGGGGVTLLSSPLNSVLKMFRTNTLAYFRRRFLEKMKALFYSERANCLSSFTAVI